MQESKYIADTVEQKYVVESGKAFKVGVVWGCFTWHETFQTIFKKFQENLKDDENLSTQKIFIRKSIIAYMLLFHKMVVFVCHYYC